MPQRGSLATLNAGTPSFLAIDKGLLDLVSRYVVASYVVQVGVVPFKQLT
jgi:hypothetical protein